MPGAYVRARCFVADWRNNRHRGKHSARATGAAGGNDAPSPPVILSTRATAGIAVSTSYGQELPIPTPGRGGGKLIPRGDLPLVEIQQVYRRECDVPSAAGPVDMVA